jgi:hypothetical protein
MAYSTKRGHGGLSLRLRLPQAQAASVLLGPEVPVLGLSVRQLEHECDGFKLGRILTDRPGRGSHDETQPEVMYPGRTF